MIKRGSRDLLKDTHTHTERERLIRLYLLGAYEKDSWRDKRTFLNLLKKFSLSFMEVITGERKTDRHI